MHNSYEKKEYLDDETFNRYKDLVDYDKAEKIYRLGLSKCDEEKEVLRERLVDLKDMRKK